VKLVSARALGLTICGLVSVGCSDRSVVNCLEPFPFFGPGESVVLVLAAATGNRLPVGGHPERPLSNASDSATAYEFVVRHDLYPVGWPSTIDSAGSLFTYRRGFIPFDTFLAVPWTHDAACRWTAWTEDEWVPAGGEALFRISTTRFSYGRQVVDLLGWYGPYPYGDSLRAKASTKAPADIAEWLAPRELGSLYRRLPQPTEGKSRAELLRGIEARYLSGPTVWVEQFPGLEMVKRARAWADSTAAF
jgi:hypothetical protein